MEGGGTVVWASSLGLFVAAGGQATSGAGAAIATSPDAINWTERTVPGAPYTSGVKFSMGNICWAPEISTLVLIGADGHNDAFGDPVLSSQTNQVWTSPDGINWTARGRIFSGNYGPTRSIAW